MLRIAIAIRIGSAIRQDPKLGTTLGDAVRLHHRATDRLTVGLDVGTAVPNAVGLKLTLTTTLGIDDGIIVGRKLMLGAKLDATDRTTIGTPLQTKLGTLGISDRTKQGLRLRIAIAIRIGFAIRQDPKLGTTLGDAVRLHHRATDRLTVGLDVGTAVSNAVGLKLTLTT